ncbi:MAG: DUF5071 domain-containing protein [Spirochaetes bacterium]|nr:DUF5071 domain-containing protein [Spirochaetota bacterium]
MNLKDYIPNNKFDIDKIEYLSKKKYPEYKLILPDLFEWIKDMNWPVARKIAPLLINAGEDIVPIVENILNTDDDVWKYWTLNYIVDKMDDSIILLIKSDLERIVRNPTDGEKIDEVDISAKQLLDKIGGREK